MRTRQRISRTAPHDQIPLDLTPSALAFREMMSFDSLPVKIRVILNYSNARHSAEECLELLNRQGIDVEKLASLIINTDAAMTRKEYRRDG
jgi:hypothetical protein